MKNFRAIFFTSVITVLGAWKVSAQARPLVSQDKAKHFAAGAFLGGSVEAFVYRKTNNRGKALLFGFGSGAAAGAAKELYDLTGLGTPSITDFLWTAAGAGVASISLHYSIDDPKPRQAKVFGF